MLAVTAHYKKWTEASPPSREVLSRTLDGLLDASVTAPVTSAALQLAAPSRNTFFYVLDNKKQVGVNYTGWTSKMYPLFERFITQ